MILANTATIEYAQSHGYGDDDDDRSTHHDIVYQLSS
jgi:hypothetical protein